MIERIRSFINSNGGTSWMLVFVFLFYALVLSLGHFTDRDSVAKAVSAQAVRLDKVSLEAKEKIFLKKLETHPEIVQAMASVILLLLLLGIGLGIFFWMKHQKGQELFLNALPQEAAHWGGKEVFQLVLFIFFAEAFVYFIEIVLSFFVDLKGLGRDAFLVANSLFRDIGVAAFVMITVVRRFKQPLRTLGLTAYDLGRNVIRGLVAYLAVIPVLFFTLVTIAMIAATFQYEPPPQEVVQIYMSHSRQDYLLYLTLFVAVLGPVVEEIFFRGFAYKALRGRWGSSGAACLSAGLFASLHMNFVAFIPIFILGVTLAWLYEQTGSLVPSMTLHAAHNLIMVGLTLSFKTFAS